MGNNKHSAALGKTCKGTDIGGDQTGRGLYTRKKDPLRGVCTSTQRIKVTRMKEIRNKIQTGSVQSEWRAVNTENAFKKGTKKTRKEG